MENATVSVLLPYRNAGGTLADAIRSTLADLRAEDELIAIDDGSDDEGPSLVHTIARIDARLRPVALGRNRGIAAALQRGVAVARGSLLARMDGDDITLPGRFAAQRALLTSEGRLGAVGVAVEPFPSPRAGMMAYVAWQNALLDEDAHARAIFVESPLCHPSTMIRRASLEAVGGFRDRGWPEDYDLWLRFHERGLRLRKIPEVLFRWRIRDDSVTRTDPRTSPERLLAARAHYLARHVAGRAPDFALWGAGRTGRRLARALEPYDLRPRFFIDIDPRKIGRTARTLPILEAEAAMTRARHEALFIIVAVGARGARAVVQQRLAANGFREGVDFLCAA